MNSKKYMFWGACIVLLLFFSLKKYPMIQFIIENDTYYMTENEFQLKWMHSVEKEAWIDIYERNKDQFLLTKTILETFGAGTPSDGVVLKSDDNKIHMEINRSIEQIDLVVSENVKTSIMFKQKDIPLYDLVRDYSNINISVTYVYLWEYLGGERLNER